MTTESKLVVADGHEWGLPGTVNFGCDAKVFIWLVVIGHYAGI